MFTIQSLHVSFEIWGCIFCAITALCTILNKSFPVGKRRIMMALQFGAAFLLLMDAMAWRYRGWLGTTGYYMVRISNFFVFLMSDVLVLLFHIYVYTSIFGEESKGQRRKQWRIPAVYIIELAGVGMVILSQFTDLYYYFDRQNIYHRNTGYPLSILFGLTGMLIDLSLLIQYRKRLKRGSFWAMLSYIILPTVASVVITFYYGISFVNIAVGISVILMFIAAIVEQSEELARKQQELYDLKVEVMMSQIKPHFIYNTLITIKHLCKTDQKMAADTIDEFAAYLRGNLDSLTKEKNISFHQELEHVKNYLAIEQKRFGDRVRVVYEIEAEDFLLPPLTLQPVVENAVKHGVTKRMEGGTIRIRSEQTETGYRITIRDDGVGYEQEKQQESETYRKKETEPDRSHVGLQNVRNRLKMLCNGTLEIESQPGVGTTVVITIPQQ